jgi:HD-GYP domain-containing protein (c-di-GMP phosphodiesterase class II)
VTTLGSTSIDRQRKSYVPVPLDMIIADRALAFALFHRDRGKGLQLACPAGEAISKASLKKLQAKGIRVLYVDTADHREYQQYADSAMDGLIAREDIPTTRKAELCYQTTHELVRDAAETSNVQAFVGERRDSWVGNLVTLITTDEAAVDGMLLMLSHDYYTYTHMVNVSVMVTALAYRMGHRDPTSLRILASGGLLHDIGKLRIDPDVLNKKERLTPEEWEEIRSHPTRGMALLHDRQDIHPKELLMVHQHHEKLDGSGYPLGLRGKEIAIEAQMTAVVDIYDALTCKRPYRAAMPHEKACAILDEEAATKLNAEMVSVWKETIGAAIAKDG